MALGDVGDIPRACLFQHTSGLKASTCCQATTPPITNVICWHWDGQQIVGSRVSDWYTFVDLTGPGPATVLRPAYRGVLDSDTHLLTAAARRYPRISSPPTIAPHNGQ
jgi:hypothetical protein